MKQIPAALAALALALVLSGCTNPLTRAVQNYRALTADETADANALPAAVAERGVLSGLTLDDYRAVWLMNGCDTRYAVADDGTWTCYDALGPLFSGSYGLPDGNGGLTLYYEGMAMVTLYPVDANTMLSSDGTVFTRDALPDFGADEDSGTLEGVWRFSDSLTWLVLDGASWRVYNAAGLAMSGTAEYDGGTAILYTDGTVLDTVGLRGVDDMYDSAGDSLVRTELPEAFADAERRAQEAAAALAASRTAYSASRSDFIGSWDFSGLALRVELDKTGHWTLYNAAGTCASGYFGKPGEDGALRLWEYDTSSPRLTLYADGSGTLYDTAGRVLTPAEGDLPTVRTDAQLSDFVGTRTTDGGMMLDITANGRWYSELLSGTCTVPAEDGSLNLTAEGIPLYTLYAGADGTLYGADGTIFLTLVQEEN